jgi:hypothetical protein
LWTVTYTLLGSSVEVDLVSANTETTNGNQFLSRIKNLFSQLGLGTDTDNMNILDLFEQLFAIKRLGVGLNL